MNKERLLKELKELNLLWSGLSRIPNFPKELLELSLYKLESINNLVEDRKEPSPKPHVEALPAEPETDPVPATASSLPAQAAAQTEEFVSPSTRRIPIQQTAKPESLVDRYEKNSTKSSLQKKLESRHFADLSKALSLNDRFRFRRDLFGNSPEKMDQALKEINTLQSMDEAITYLNKNYSEYSESESFTDFCNLLDNHFTS